MGYLQIFSFNKYPTANNFIKLFQPNNRGFYYVWKYTIVSFSNFIIVIILFPSLSIL